jgi:hypothetical protein
MYLSLTFLDWRAMIQYHDMIPHSSLSLLIMVPHHLFCIHVVHDTSYDTLIVSSVKYLKKSKIIHGNLCHLNTYSCKFPRNNIMVCGLHKKKNLKLCYTAYSPPHTRNSTICHFCIDHIFLYSRFRFGMLIPGHTISNHDLYQNLFLNSSTFFQKSWFIGVWYRAKSPR